MTDATALKHDVFQAIADPTRRRMLMLLSQREMPISELAAHFPQSRTAVVKHLQILSDAKLVHGRKSGREKIYRLQPEPLRELHDWLAYFERFWENKLAMLKFSLEAETAADSGEIRE